MKFCGYKSQHLDDRLRFNVTAFWNDFEDKQESVVEIDNTTNTVATIFRNAASVEYKGIELETQYVFNENFRAFFNYGYLDAEYDEFVTDLNPNDGDPSSSDASFLNPRNAPEFTWSLGGTLSIPVGAGAVEVFAKYTKIDELDTALLNTELGKADEQEILTATVGYYTDNWSLVAFGRNLTDDQSEVQVPIATLFAVGTVTRPRTYGLEFTYQFD